MRKSFLSLALAFGTIAATFSSCSPTSNEPATVSTGAQTETATDSTATQVAAMAYMCPMECTGSASMQPGKCPVCGMDLVQNPAYQADSTKQQ